MNKIYDIYNIDQGEFFKQSRTIYIYGEINSNTAFEVCSRLKYLDYLDSEKEITIEINSGGGEVNSGLAIIDTINCIKAPVKVLVSGLAASMAVPIVSSGSKGLRCALPHSIFMIHQPLGGMGMSQASDIDIYAKHILKVKQTVNKILADTTKNDIDKIERDTDRDYYLTAQEALEYGIIDKIVETKKV